jgi:uncharacterized protein RhaS with RHS repeats
MTFGYGSTFPDWTSTNYTYDASNVVTATITRTYDGLDRLTQEVTAEGTVNYTWKDGGRCLTFHCFRFFVRPRDGVIA